MCFFFFNDTATTEIYTLSLHDALPISESVGSISPRRATMESRISLRCCNCVTVTTFQDRKSTRLNSSHDQISYAVFCLKKKKVTNTSRYMPKKTACCTHHPPIKLSRTH